MHKLNRNPISIDDNLKIVRKGLRAEQRAFFDAEKDNLKNAFEKYDSSSTTAPVSLVLKTEDIHPPKTGISVHFLAPLVYRNCKTSLFSRTRSTDSRQVIDN